MKRVLILTICLILVISSLLMASCEKKQTWVEPEIEATVYPVYEPQSNFEEIVDESCYVTLLNMRESQFSDAIIPENSTSNIKSVTDIQFLDAISGEYSRSQTRSRYGVINADIGVMGSFKDKLYFFFGDTSIVTTETESGRKNYTNTCAYITDFDYTKGIELTYVTGEDGKAILVSPELKGEGKNSYNQSRYEAHRIPTGAIEVNDTFYMLYNGITEFNKNGDPNDWNCNCGGMSKSTDGETWTDVTTYMTQEDSLFVQNFPVDGGDGYIYVFGHGEGRYTPCILARVLKENFEDYSKYEFLTEYNDKGNVWKDYDEGGLDDAVEVVSGQVWEHSVMYNEYLEEWLFTYTNSGSTFIYSSKNIAGPYSLAATIAKPKKISNWYCAYTSPLLTRGNGKKMVYIVSNMISVSSGQWMCSAIEVTFNRG